MPFDCQTCGSAEYDEDDGLYFCKECGTQSQELIVQEAEYGGEVNICHEVKVGMKDVSKDRGFKPKASLGRPWTLYEAYQIIIQAQAEALVTLGAKEELKEIIFTVWANYLSKIGVAFTKKEKVVPRIVENMRVGRQRELHRGSFDTIINRRKVFKKSKVLEKEINGEAEDHIDEDVITNGIFIKEFDSDNEDGSKNSGRDSYALRYSKARRSPEWMNLEKTIALCYIGLLFTHSDILPHEIIRWIYESKIPFLSVTHLLHSDMVLSAGDQALFEVGRFNTNNLVKEVNLLSTYLNLTDLPSPDLKEIVVRFVKAFYLPSEIISVSLNLVDKIPFSSNEKRTYFKRIDHLAMAYLILALRFVFGIDDSTEYLLSEYSSKLQEILSLDQIRVFVWTDWKKFCDYQSSEVFHPYKTLTSDYNITKISHLDNLVSCYTNLALDKKRYTTHVTLNKKQRPVRCYEQEFREALRKPLEVAADRLDGLNPQFSDDMGTSDKPMENKGNNFVNSTLCHILDVELFKKKISTSRIKEEAKILSVTSQYMPMKSGVSQYKYDIKEEELVYNRHQNYMWLLRLASQTVDCKLLNLDKLVVRLTDYILAISRKEITENTLRSKIGFIKTKGRKK
ncbi:hypothetical protein Btru_029167 [Bulinus truncatus]|nr:hypothetical protein Btru_029167 [Bulinus truncatus]